MNLAPLHQAYTASILQIDKENDVFVSREQTKEKPRTQVPKGKRFCSESMVAFRVLQRDSGRFRMLLASSSTCAPRLKQQAGNDKKFYNPCSHFYPLDRGNKHLNDFLHSGVELVDEVVLAELNLTRNHSLRNATTNLLEFEKWIRKVALHLFGWIIIFRIVGFVKGHTGQ